MPHSNIQLTTAADAAFMNRLPLTGALLGDLTNSRQNF
jgi:hypothetical protein